MSEHAAQAEPALELPEAKPLEEQAAAGRIQRFWRWCRYASTTRLLTWRFERLKLKLSKDAATFEQLHVLLKDDRVIQTIRQYVRRLLRTSEQMHIPYKIRSDEKFKIIFNHRKIATAFMIGNWPMKVFESMGQTEEELLTASRALLSSMDIISKHIQATGGFYKQPQDLSMPFHQMIDQFLTCFEKYAIPDNKKLTTRIAAALIALYASQERLLEDDPDYHRLKTEHQDQIQRLRNKMATACRHEGREGSGDAILAKFDASRAAGTVVADFGVGSNNMEMMISDVNDNIMATLPRERIASELMLDPNFELTPDYDVDRSKRDLENAMWDRLLVGLEQNPPNYSIVLKVVKDIRESLTKLSLEDTPIAEIMDVSHIDQQLSNNSWDWASCKYITWTILNILIRSNPERAEETLTMWNDDVGNALRMAEPQDQPRALKNALKFLTERVNLARTDAANKM